MEMRSFLPDGSGPPVWIVPRSLTHSLNTALSHWKSIQANKKAPSEEGAFLLLPVPEAVSAVLIRADFNLYRFNESFLVTLRTDTHYSTVKL